MGGGGGVVKISCGGGVSKNHEKNKRLSPVYFEPESTIQNKLSYKVNTIYIEKKKPYNNEYIIKV